MVKVKLGRTKDRGILEARVNECPLRVQSQKEVETRVGVNME